MTRFRGKNSRWFVNVGEQICNLRNEGNKKKEKESQEFSVTRGTENEKNGN